MFTIWKSPPILHECVSLKLKRIHVIATRETIKTITETNYITKIVAEVWMKNAYLFVWMNSTFFTVLCKTIYNYLSKYILLGLLSPFKTAWYLSIRDYFFNHSVILVNFVNVMYTCIYEINDTILKNVDCYVTRMPIV